MAEHQGAATPLERGSVHLRNHAATVEEVEGERPRLGLFQTSQQLSGGLSTNFFAYHLRLIGGSVAMLGVLTALAHVIPNILQPIWGKASDRTQRRLVWLRLGTGILVIGLGLMALTDNPRLMVFAVVIHAVGLSMVVPVWNGLVTDIYRESERAQAFARFGQIGLMANVAGSAIAGIIVSFGAAGQTFARGFALAAIVNLIGMLVLGGRTARSNSSAVASITTKATVALPPSADLHLEHPIIGQRTWKGYLRSQWSYILVMSTIWPLVPLTMLDRLNLSNLHVVAFVITGQVSTLIWQPHVPAMLEREHSLRLIRRARLAIALIPLSYAACSLWPAWWGFWLMILIQVVYGHPVAVMNIASPTVVSAASPAQERARRFGVHNAGIGVAALIGSTVAGVTIDVLLRQGLSLTTLLVGVYLFSTFARCAVAWFGFAVREEAKPATA